ncbi:MAG: 50S ribosomal protein L23 [Eubacteriales bacterium]|nr:50S ribosomal protein L23 [Eubacteriales bacterium]
MKTYQDIIIKPYITEKSNNEIASGKYTFVVDKEANKTEVREAVEHLFNVKVVNVNIANCKGKPKRVGVHLGKTSDWKKAIVKIDLDPKAETYIEKGGKQTVVNKKYKTSIDEFGAAQ